MTKEIRYHVPPALKDLAVAVRNSKDPHDTFQKMGVSMNMDLVEAVSAAGFEGVDEFILVCQKGKIQVGNPDSEITSTVIGVITAILVIAFFWWLLS